MKEKEEKGGPALERDRDGDQLGTGSSVMGRRGSGMSPECPALLKASKICFS